MCTFLSQDDDTIVYCSSPPLPEITRPTQLLPSAHDPIVQRRQQRAVESVDITIIFDSDQSSPSVDIEESGAGGGGSCTEGDSASSYPIAPRNTTYKRKASSSEEARYVSICI